MKEELYVEVFCFAFVFLISCFDLYKGYWFGAIFGLIIGFVYLLIILKNALNINTKDGKQKDESN